MSTADFLTVEHQVLGLFDTLDRTSEPKDAAGYASERLPVHYDLDLLGLARSYPPSTPGTLEGREALLLEYLGAAAGMVALEARVSVAVLDALIDVLTAALTSQVDEKAAAVWACNRVIGATGIDGVVHDPTDSNPGEAAVRHLRAASVLLERQSSIFRGGGGHPVLTGVAASRLTTASKPGGHPDPPSDLCGTLDVPEHLRAELLEVTAEAETFGDQLPEPGVDLHEVSRPSAPLRVIAERDTDRVGRGRPVALVGIEGEPCVDHVVEGAVEVGSANLDGSFLGGGGSSAHELLRRGYAPPPSP